MTDLPQHAAQVSLALALLEGTSPWGDLFRVNYFTPYLVGYALAGLVALVFPIAVATKIVLTSAFYGFVSAGIALRKALGSDKRLDWLFVPGFFGFAFKWGFFTFLVAAPFGLLFLLLAKAYSDRPTVLNAVYVFCFGLVLFFCHGLIFLTAVGVGAVFVAVHPGPVRVRFKRLAPYAAFVPIVVAYYLYTTRIEAPTAAGTAGILWQLGPQRLAQLVIDIWGTVEDWPFGVAGLLALAFPFLIGSRLQKDRRALAPFVWLFIVWMTMPISWMKTDFLYSRFALFTLPFYALMFRAPSADAEPPARMAFASGAARIAMPLVCILFLATVGARVTRFARESSDFDLVAGRAQPARRALALVFDRSSRAANDPSAYLSYASWYQAERGGLVEFNFAAFLPQIVRYRPHVLVPQPRLAASPQSFDWVADHGSSYHYFFVRSSRPPPADFLANPQCTVRLVDSAGKWYLYENVSCD